ncbi:ABC transporter ATP-binding protein [soil metagenome]|nr:ATP-binding cassette domain-containing protein [Acidobacteriota bacterium]
MNSAVPVLEIRGMTKSYAGLRPLRIRALAIAPGERVAIRGIDAPAAELLVNLVTGAALPDQGEILVDGRSTADIADGDEWLASLDRFGIVSSRAVLLEGATLEQNLAMPFTLQIDPIPDDVRARVAALGADCGITREWLDQPAGALPAEIRVRVHLARAVALEPRLLVVEHPTASVPPTDHPGLARDVTRVTESRRVAALIVTMDQAFASAAAHRALTLNPATGDLKEAGKGWFW